MLVLSRPQSVLRAGVMQSNSLHGTRFEKPRSHGPWLRVSVEVLSVSNLHVILSKFDRAPLPGRALTGAVDVPPHSTCGDTLLRLRP